MKCPYCSNSKLILTGGFVQARISIDCYRCCSCNRERTSLISPPASAILRTSLIASLEDFACSHFSSRRILSISSSSAAKVSSVHSSTSDTSSPYFSALYKIDYF